MPNHVCLQVPDVGRFQMTRVAVDAVIREFGAAYGTPDMALDDEDFVCFTTQEGVLINVDYFEADDCLVMYTTIGEVFDETRLLLYDELLKANFFWDLTGGATLCITPDGAHALLTSSVMADNLDVTTLTNVFQHMNQLTFAWAARMREITEDSLAAECAGDPTGRGDVRPPPARFA